MKNLVIFASGAGSNAENIIIHFTNNSLGKVAAVFCNKANAGVFQKAEKHHIPVVLFTREEFSEGRILQKLQSFNPDLIILAGFLLKFPQNLIERFQNKIINIHPALLPKYGGKGMYGMNVHHAVSNNKELETGITIHYVDEHYDEGDIIFQKTVPLKGTETVEEISALVRQLEHQYFPQLLEQLLSSGKSKNLKS